MKFSRKPPPKTRASWTAMLRTPPRSSSRRFSLPTRKCQLWCLLPIFFWVRVIYKKNLGSIPEFFYRLPHSPHLLLLPLPFALHYSKSENIFLVWNASLLSFLQVFSTWADFARQRISFSFLPFSLRNHLKFHPTKRSLILQVQVKPPNSNLSYSPYLFILFIPLLLLFLWLTSKILSPIQLKTWCFQVLMNFTMKVINFMEECYFYLYWNEMRIRWNCHSISRIRFEKYLEKENLANSFDFPENMELKTTICLLLIFTALFLLLPWIVYNEESGPEQENLELKFERELKVKEYSKIDKSGNLLRC